MSTPAQAAANRANSQHSTGPKSPEGKARVALNPLTHGLARTRMFLPGEAPDEFVAFQQELAGSFHCETAAEKALADDAALAWWKIRRITEWQTDVMTSALTGVDLPEPLTKMFGASHEAALNTLQRYETSARGALHRAISQLRQLEKHHDAARASGERSSARAIDDAIKRYVFAPMPGASNTEALLQEALNRAKPISAPDSAKKFSARAEDWRAG